MIRPSGAAQLDYFSEARRFETHSAKAAATTTAYGNRSVLASKLLLKAFQASDCDKLRKWTKVASFLTVRLLKVLDT